MTTKIIYFKVGGFRDEKAEFRTTDSTEEIQDTFKAAAEAGPYDILKLYNDRGNIVNISPKLADNTPNTQYRLEVVASHCDMNFLGANPIGININEIESRIAVLEKKMTLTPGSAMPEGVQNMKTKVEDFREKLESVEHLSWLGLFKDISSGTSLQPFWDKKNWNDKNTQKQRDEEAHSVYEKFLKMSDVSVTDSVRQYLRKPTFDNWQWDNAEMMMLLRQMFLDLGYTTKFNIELPVLHQWLHEIHKHYNSVPFHNFKHCFMVTQMMYGISMLLDLPRLLGDLDVLILITSTICHDLDHPGYNNAYQINARTELALLYNDISPLENHHCSVAFEILENPNANIFRNLEPETFKKVREGMIRCILATDMSKHSEILTNFKAIIPDFDYSNNDHKSLLMMVLIKMSDISNEARPPEVAEPWLDCLLQEFFNQSDIEKIEGLPVAPFMDRDKVKKPASQMGFIKFVLLPLFEAIGELLPALQEHLIEPVRKALQYYTDMHNALEEENIREESV